MGYSHAVFGNLNLDIYIVVEDIPGPDEDRRALEVYMGPGGAAANYSVAVSRAGHKAALIAHTGSLAVNLGLLRRLSRSGVDVSMVRVHEGEEAGLVMVMVSAKGGERAMISMRGANRFLRGDEVRGLAYDIVHVASVEPGVYMNAVRNLSVRMFSSYDPGESITRRYSSSVFATMPGTRGIVYLNRVEFRDAVGVDLSLDAVRRVARRLGDVMLVVKLGAEGAMAAVGDVVYRVEAYRHGSVVDTTGAGDVFAAFFNVYFAETGDPVLSLRAASAAAGIKVTRRGAQSAPMRDEVEEVVGRGRPRAWRVS